MDIRSMYAIKLGETLDTYPPDISENLADHEFKVVVEDGLADGEDGKIDDTFFDHVLDAIDAALALASDPRDFEVYLGLDVASQDAMYVTIEHAAIVREGK